MLTERFTYRRGGIGREKVSEEKLIGVLACMIGGVVLARIVPEKESNEVLRACREFLDAGLNESPPATDTFDQNTMKPAKTYSQRTTTQACLIAC